MTTETDLSSITWRIEKLEAEKKDLWDKFSILAAVKNKKYKRGVENN